MIPWLKRGRKLKSVPWMHWLSAFGMYWLNLKVCFVFVMTLPPPRIYKPIRLPEQSNCGDSWINIERNEVIDWLEANQ